MCKYVYVCVCVWGGLCIEVILETTITASSSSSSSGNGAAAVSSKDMPKPKSATLAANGASGKSVVVALSSAFNHECGMMQVCIF